MVYLLNFCKERMNTVSLSRKVFVTFYWSTLYIVVIFLYVLVLRNVHMVTDLVNTEFKNYLVK